MMSRFRSSFSICLFRITTFQFVVLSHFIVSQLLLHRFVFAFQLFSFSTTRSSSTRVWSATQDVSPFRSPSPSKDDGHGIANTDLKKNDVSLREDPFHSFDYLAHWYPVIWSTDLPTDRPVKVTVFDVDYVVARTSDGNVIAMLDKCPHKQAALSEGRITSKGAFQCAYHGWSFNGETGECIDIPQVRIGMSNDALADRAGRLCGTAVPAMLHQNMIWLFPGGGIEQALKSPPPPSIPELDMPGFSTRQQIRDFPIDWPILLENIMDPDHGLFAHQAKPFDLYAATKDIPMSIEEMHTNEGKGWTIISRVKAVEKLVEYDKEKRSSLTGKGKSKQTKEKSAIEDAKISTTTFHAPTLVTMGRRDVETNSTTFMTAFYICPVGTGRSRFMACNVMKSPFNVPRWIFHLGILNFLDEDTYLLATQQRAILKYEAEFVEKQRVSLLQRDERKVASDDQDIDQMQKRMPTDTRRSGYVYKSPTEKLGIKLGRFWDSTLNRVPNRIPALLAMKQRGAFLSIPERRVVLDRESQHLRICPDSQDIVRRCNYVIHGSKAISLAVVVLKAWAVLGMMSPTSYGSFRFMQNIGRIFNPSLIGYTIAISFIASYLAKKLRREFFFKFDESYRDKKVDGIVKVWLDP